MGRCGWRVVLDAYRLSSPIGADCRSKIARYGLAEPRSAWSFYGKAARRESPGAGRQRMTLPIIRQGIVQYGIVRRGFSPASERLSDNSQRNTGVFNDLPVTVQGISGQPLTGRKPDNSIPSLLLSDPAVSLLPAGFLFSRQISLLPPGYRGYVSQHTCPVVGRVEPGALRWSPRASCMPWHTRPNGSRRKVAPRAAFCGFAYAGTYVIWHYGPTAERNTHRPAHNVCPGIHKPTFRRQTGQDDTHLARNVCPGIHKPSTPRIQSA